MISDIRLQKIAKLVLDECFKDRERALEVYQQFFDYLKTANIPVGVDVVKGILDSLKLAQSTFGNVLKLVDVMVKLNIVMASKQASGDLNEKGRHKDLYASLEDLRNSFDPES